MINTNQTMAPPELNAQFNNLIYLYVQNTTTPILRHFKPYFTMRHAVYHYRPPSSKKPDISDINYYFDNHNNRSGALHSLNQLSENSLLEANNKATKRNETIIKKVMRTDCIRDCIKSPVFAFRVKCAYKQSGNKYFINLATHTAYSRLNNSKKTASNYYINPQLTLIEIIK
jgi:hypothetical protein